ncbi:MAG: chloramphenicol phosphotransferase CPT family protein [Opitutales bacterium]
MPAAFTKPVPAAPFADVILLNGTSSSGKTSLARALQRQAGAPLLHASLDTFTDMFDWEAVTDPATRRACHEAGVDHFHAALARFAAGPFGLVVDHVLCMPAWLEATRRALAARPVVFVGVRCPLAVVVERERQRPDRRPGMAAGQFEHIHRGLTYDIEVDTATDSPEACAARVLDFARRRPARP